MGKLYQKLCVPEDILPLVLFRVFFGLVMAWEYGIYIESGRISRYYIEPQFHFTYYGFEWVKPWPGEWMYVHFYVLFVLALMIAAGFCYRFATTLHFFGFTYVFLLEQSEYLNHFYLISLFSFLMIFTPAHRARSVDVLLRPRIRTETVPVWHLWLLRFQVGIPYFFGGLAKLNGDWLHGEPLRRWFMGKQHTPLIGPLLGQEPVILLANYGSLLLDLTVVPLLLWKKTRPYAFGAAVAFHLMNANLFNIGIFPWFMIAATLLYFPAGWIRRCFNRPQLTPADSRLTRPLWLGFAGLYVFLQILLPLRHYLYPGDASWTEEAHRFSWRMMLRSKSASVRFLLRDPVTGRQWYVYPKSYLTPNQTTEFSGDPDMILQFGHFLAQDHQRKGLGQVEVRAQAMASLNGRKSVPLIDPNSNLAAQPRNIWPAKWILPLTEPRAGN